MKNRALFFAGWIATGFLAVAVADQNGAQTADYLKLTRENLPHVQVLIQEALDNMDILPDDLISQKKRTRNSALLPKIRLMGSLTRDAVPEYGTVNDFSTMERRFEDNNVVSLQQDIDRYGLNGEYDDRFFYGVSAQWDLGNLIWGAPENLQAQQTARKSSSRRRRITEVSARYFALAAVLPDDSSGEVDDSDVTTVIEQALYLDRISGNYLSRMLVVVQRRSEILELCRDTVSGDDLSRMPVAQQRMEHKPTAIDHDIWFEAEAPNHANFDVHPEPVAAAFGGAVVKLDAASPPVGTDGFVLGYDVKVEESGEYEVYVASLPAGQSWSSPIDWRIGDAPFQRVVTESKGLNSYSYDPTRPKAKYYFFKLGTIQLSAGSQLFELKISEKRKMDGKLVMELDAVCLKKK